MATKSARDLAHISVGRDRVRTYVTMYSTPAFAISFKHQSLLRADKDRRDTAPNGAHLPGDVVPTAFGPGPCWFQFRASKRTSRNSELLFITRPTRSHRSSGQR